MLALVIYIVNSFDHDWNLASLKNKIKKKELLILIQLLFVHSAVDCSKVQLSSFEKFVFPPLLIIKPSFFDFSEISCNPVEFLFPESKCFPTSSKGLLF